LIFGTQDYTHTVYLQLQYYAYFNSKQKSFPNIIHLFNDLQKYFNEEPGEIYLSVLSRSLTKEDNINEIFKNLNNKYKLSNEYLKNNKYFNEKFEIQTSYNKILINTNETEQKTILSYSKFLQKKLKDLKDLKLENIFFLLKSKDKKISRNSKISFKTTLFQDKNEEVLIKKIEKIHENNKKYFES
jgi:hypothetical protein